MRASGAQASGTERHLSSEFEAIVTRKTVARDRTRWTRLEQKTSAALPNVVCLSAWKRRKIKTDLRAMVCVHLMRLQNTDDMCATLPRRTIRSDEGIHDASTTTFVKAAETRESCRRVTDAI